MRIALISDIHGNAVALKAVLKDIDRAAVERVICLGDVATLGPDPGAVVQTIQALGCECVMGNHDAFLLDPAMIQSYTEAPVIVAAVDWCRRQLSVAQLALFRSFQPRIELTLNAQATLLLFHGTPRSHMENLLATTPAEEVDQMLAGYSATVLAGGHTHIQMLRQHRGRLIVNVGSVGLPFREFVNGQAPTLLHHAEYAIIEAHPGGVSVDLRRVQLDRQALYAAAAASDTPLRPMLQAEYI
jgi:putative phosphoesterase